MTSTFVEPYARTSQVVLSSGLRMHVVHGGPADGPAVLMLHGLGDSWFSFSRVLKYVPAHVRFLVPDQRGHGDTDRPLAGYSLDDYATDASQLLDASGIERALVVGHSMGSFVARRFAERFPQRVSKLVLIGTALVPENPVLEDLRGLVASLTDPVDEQFIREFQMSTVVRTLPPDFLARIIQESRKLPARVWRSALEGLLEFRPQWPITCPTQILGGDRDAIFSHDEHAALFRSTERATLHLEPGVGHALHWEAPEVFASLVLKRLTN